MLYNFIRIICTLFVVRRTILFVRHIYIYTHMCVFVLIYAKNGPKMVVKYKTDVRQLKRYCTGL